MENFISEKLFFSSLRRLLQVKSSESSDWLCVCGFFGYRKLTGNNVWIKSLYVISSASRGQRARLYSMILWCLRDMRGFFFSFFISYLFQNWSEVSIIERWMMMEKTELNFYDTSNARHRGDDGSCDPPGYPFSSATSNSASRHTIQFESIIFSWRMKMKMFWWNFIIVSTATTFSDT